MYLIGIALILAGAALWLTAVKLNRQGHHMCEDDQDEADQALARQDMQMLAAFAKMLRWIALMCIVAGSLFILQCII